MCHDVMLSSCWHIVLNERLMERAIMAPLEYKAVQLL